MPDQRKTKRFKTNTFVGIYEENTNILVGCLVDLSIDGMQVICEVPLRDNAKYKLRIELPKFICKEGMLVLSAENVWIQNYSKPGFYTAGFKFNKLSLDLRKRIEDIIESKLFDLINGKLTEPQLDT